MIRTSSQVETGAINTADIRDGRGVSLADLTPRARFRLSAATGDRGEEGARGAQGPAGPRGATGAAGANGADGSAVAFAHVNPDGTLDDGRSKQVVSAAMAAPGPGLPRAYCLDLVPASVSNAVASIDYATAQSGVETICPLLPGTANGLSSTIITSRCPAAQQDAAAVVVDVLGTTPETLWPERGFFIAFN
ncbi:MAG: hypothetical protein H0T69_20075 [Thermoleophilaceae bacterium]|nr:hypothetical protein [Thermoleophilaceae bacterium]